jgi:hypothetical protein
MQGFCTVRARHRTTAILAGALALGPLQAQDLPTDRQLQTAFGSV